MAKITLTPGMDERVPEGTSFEIQVSPSASDEDIERSAEAYLDSRYGPKNPVKTPKLLDPPKTYMGMRPVEPPTAENRGSRFVAGLKRGMQGLLSTVPGHAGPSMQHIKAADPKHPTWQELMGPSVEEQEKPAARLEDAPIVSNIVGLAHGDIVGQAGEVLPAAALGAVSASPKVRAVGKGFVKGVNEAKPRLTRSGPAGLAGGIIGLATRGYPGMWEGSLIGASAGVGGQYLASGIRGAAREASRAPWLNEANPFEFLQKGKIVQEQPMPTTRQVSSPARPMPPAQPTPTAPMAQLPPPEPLQIAAPPQGIPMPPAGLPETPLLPQPAGFQHPRVVNPVTLQRGAMPEPITEIAAPQAPVAAQPIPPAALSSVTGPVGGVRATPPTAKELMAKKVKAPATPAAPIAPSPEMNPTQITKATEQAAAKPKTEPALEPANLPKPPEPKPIAGNPYDEAITEAQVSNFIKPRVETMAKDLQEEFGVSADKAKKLLVGLESKGTLKRTGNSFVSAEKSTEKVPTLQEALDDMDKRGQNQFPATKSKPVKPHVKKAVAEELDEELATGPTGGTLASKPVKTFKEYSRDRKILELQRLEEPTPAQITELEKLIKERDNAPSQQATKEVKPASKSGEKHVEQAEAKPSETTTPENPQKGSDEALALTEPSWEPGKQVTMDHLYKMANAMGLKPQPLARQLLQAGYDVEPGRLDPTWGLGRVGKGKRGAEGVRDTTLGVEPEVWESKLKALVEKYKKKP